MGHKNSNRNYVDKLSAGVHQVHVEIDIHMPAEHVYGVLTDFAALREWSTKWVENEGPFELGKTCSCVYRVGKREMKFTHEIMESVPGRIFAWSGKTIAGMRNYHSFEMRPTGEGSCTLIQEDLSRGGMAFLLGRPVQKNNLRDYAEFNTQIKARAESTWAA